MRIDVLTLFPEMFDSLKHSIIGRAVDGGLIEVNAIDIREFSLDKHKKCDDYSFGGGPGMVMTPQPIFDAINSVDPEKKSLRIFLSPTGTVLSHSIAKKIVASGRNVLLLCGHYEGIDRRVIDLCIDEEISIGDYVLTGGELPAMVLIDVLSRFVPGVLGSGESAEYESFSDGLLEYPQYTRPQVFEGVSVPDVLISGHHKNIEEWRRRKSEEITKTMRPDLWERLQSKLAKVKDDNDK